MGQPHNAIVWRFDADPYGNGIANEDPDGNGQFVQFNLRKPGEYWDVETGLLYNYYRYRDPLTGYLQPDPIGLLGGSFSLYSFVGGNPVSFVDPFGLAGSPGIGDQFNPGGLRGSGSKDYTSYFDKRFPNTIAGAKILFDQRIKKMICEVWSATASGLYPGLNGGSDDIDVQPDMKRFGDRSQSAYERNVELGAFQLKTDAVKVNWDDPGSKCSRCFTYSTVMYALENTGDNRIPGFRERSVQMGTWALSGKGCCGGF